LALDEKEALLLELFPSVAEKFLRGRRIADWKRDHPEETGIAAVPTSAPTAGEKSKTFSPTLLQNCEIPAFSSLAAELPADYQVDDGHDEEYWDYAVKNAQ
jgi:hypothetical protein